MPIYEYSCSQCNFDFELLVDLSESEKRQTCPECGSRKTKKAFSIFGFASDSGGSSSKCGTCSSGNCSTC